MKKLILILFAFFLLIGCSTGTKVSNSAYSTYNLDQQRYNEIARNTQTGELQFQKGTKISEEEDDDITSLFSVEDQGRFDIPIVFNDAVQYYVSYFSTQKKKVFTNWLKRSKRYAPMFTRILREQGLPEDLVYLAMIESGFNPKAYSRAKACGPWQFIYATGGRYGLKVNNWVDERRDPEKSTVAAAKYLKDLFNQFGCWYLAAAGYNAGENRVERAIEKHNTNDFWELVKYNALPRETREYIPQLIAAAIIAKEPEKYGFGNIEYETPLVFEEVKVSGGMPLAVIASAARIDVEDLRLMNPEILKGITPPNEDVYSIKLPCSVNIDAYSKNMEVMAPKSRRVKSVTVYKVKRRDTLARIMKKYRIDYDDLKLVNDCGKSLRVKRGALIYIPLFNANYKRVASVNEADNDTGKREASKTAANVQAKKIRTSNNSAQGRQVYHTVKKGETLSEISGKYSINVSELKKMNNLKSDRLYANMKLRLVSYGKKTTGKKIRYHTVKKGETLTRIAEKYNVEIDDIKSANHLKSDILYRNMKLKIIKNES